MRSLRAASAQGEFLLQVGNETQRGGGGSEWSPGWNLLEEAVVSGVTEKRDNFILRNCSKEGGFLLTGLIVLDSAH